MKKKGVTLLELVVVVVIISILASLTYPAYRRIVSRSRESEGWVLLAAIRSSELRYYSENEEQFIIILPQLDIDTTSTPFFTYTARQTTVRDFTAVATPRAACGGCRKLCLDHAGTKGEAGACP